MERSPRSPHELILRGVHVPDQKVRGHFPFAFHFDFAPLRYFEALVFQGSAQKRKRPREQRARSVPGASAATGRVTRQKESGTQRKAYRAGTVQRQG